MQTQTCIDEGKKHLLNAITELAIAVANLPASDEKCRKFRGSLVYALGQSIRQWVIPDTNWHTSKAALALWKELTGEDHMPYHEYAETFECKKNDFMVPTFEGTKKDYQECRPVTTIGEKGLKKDKITYHKYKFNTFFIAEHTTPVAEIRDAIIDCYNNNKSNEDLPKYIENILDKIHITQMLKIEDRRIIQNQIRLSTLAEETQTPVYKWLLDKDREDIFKELVDNFYCKLSTKNTLKEELVQYQNTWEALNLDKEYTIEI